MPMSSILTCIGFLAVGLYLLFSKTFEEMDFFYMFDGKRKASQKWRKFKRVALGLGMVVTALSVLIKILIEANV